MQLLTLTKKVKLQKLRLPNVSEHSGGTGYAHDQILVELKPNAIMQVAGANWLMIGPAEQAEWVFPAVAVTDTYIASAAGDLGTRPLEESHPIYKAFL